MEKMSELSRPSLIPGGSKISKWPWWAIALVLAGLAFGSLYFTSANYHETFTYLIQGVYTTLRITLFSYLIATVIGLLAGLARVSKNIILFNISTLYVELVRGIPLVVLLLYFAFALFPLFVTAVTNLGTWGVGLLPNSGFFQNLADFQHSGCTHGRTRHHCAWVWLWGL